jgi:hypothetical protein
LQRLNSLNFEWDSKRLKGVSHKKKKRKQQLPTPSTRAEFAAASATAGRLECDDNERSIHAYEEEDTCI